MFLRKLRFNRKLNLGFLVSRPLRVNELADTFITDTVQDKDEQRRCPVVEEVDALQRLDARVGGANT